MTAIAWPLLRNAPISEAIIDIQVQLGSDFDVKRLLELHTQIKTDYPTSEEAVSWEDGLEAKEGRGTGAGAHVNGYIFKSTDERQVVQFRLDGFTFSRLRPYESWAALKEDAQKLWQVYAAAARPESVRRISARYINQMDIPKNIATVGDWLRVPPMLPPIAGLSMRGFFQSLFVVDTATELSAMITQMLQPQQKNPAEDTIVLDIDVFREGNFELGDKVWQTLDDCRGIKNRIFFESLTEKLVARYK